MFIKDIRTEFYEKIVGKKRRVLLLVNHDVDALCATKVLLNLFHADNVNYMLVPITGKDQLKRAYTEHAESHPTVVLINCGATIDVIDFLDMGPGRRVYIADNHRPVDIVNVYNGSQVFLVMRPDEETGPAAVPAYDDVFWDSDNEEQGSVQEEQLLRNRKRQWENKRQQLIFDYEEFSFYGSSTAFLFHELSWRLSRDSNDTLWWSIVGVTSMYILDMVDKAKYLSDVDAIRPHVARLNHHDDADLMSIECSRIVLSPELRLFLYRKWSLYESLINSPFTACALRTWTNRGHKQLLQILADMGIPLAKSKQKFGHMESELRKNIRDVVDQTMTKHGVEQVSYTSFYKQFGFKHCYCAADVSLAVGAILEHEEEGSSYLHALDSLSHRNVVQLESGLSLGVAQTVAIYQTVQTLVDMNQVVSAGPFFFAYIQDGVAEWRMFTQPHCFRMLANFLLRAHVASHRSKSKRAPTMPLILSAPLDTENATCILTGLPPLAENSPKNLFGKAFEQAALRSKSRILQDNFDSSIISLRLEDRTRFMDALIALLTT